MYYLEEYILDLIDIYGFDDIREYIEKFNETEYEIISNLDKINLLINKDVIKDENYILEHCSPEYYLEYEHVIQNKYICKKNKRMDKFLKNLSNNRKIFCLKCENKTNIKKYIKYLDRDSYYGLKILKTGNLDTFKLFIKKGGRCNIYGEKIEIIESLLENKKMKLVDYIIDTKLIDDDQINLLFRKYCSEANIELINFFLKKFPNTNEYNNLGLKIAIYNNNTDLIQFFIKNGAKFEFDDDMILIKTIRHNSIELTEMIIHFGYDVTYKSNALSWASMSDNLDIIKYLIKEGVDKNVYNEALIYAEDLDVIECLVDNGADIHFHNEFAFINACKHGKLDVVKYLIKNGADIHYENDKALIIACRKGNMDIVKYLIRKGADFHNEKEKILIIACRKGNIDVVKYLVKKGANIHYKNEKALFKASQYENMNIVEYLIKNGANFK